MCNAHGHVVKMPFSAGTKRYMTCWLKLWYITSTNQGGFIIWSNEVQAFKAC